MDIYAVVLLISIVIGGALIAYALVVIAKDGGEVLQDTFGGNTAAEADLALAELNAVARAVFAELDEKYQELLYLYTLIDARKAEMAAGQSETVKVGERRAAKSGNLHVNPRQREILQLHAQNLDIPHIAKQMNIGQGEVKLVLELEKKR